MLNKNQDEITKKWSKSWHEPMVTISCAVFNHAKYIEQALDSFLMQETNFPFEIFVHDDASTDNSANIIRKYEKKYPKLIKPVYETENQYSKNDGSLQEILWSEKYNRGKYIALCEGDDYWTTPLKLQKQFDFMERHEDFSIVGCSTNVVDESGNFIRDNQLFLINLYGKKDTEIKTINEYCDLPHTSTLFFKNFFHKDFYYCQEKFEKNWKLFKGWDKSLCLFFLSMGKMYYMTEIMSCYRFVQSGKDNWTSLMNTTNKTKVIAEIETNMLKQVKEYGLNVDIRPHFYRNVVLYAILFFLRKRNIENFKMILYALKVCPSKISLVLWFLRKIRNLSQKKVS